MSTALSTTVKTIDYPALSPNSRQMRIIEANRQGQPMQEQDLVRVKTPLGGSTTWSFEVNGNVETTDEIVGLLVAIGRRGYLWPSDDPTEQRPVIVSPDLLVGYRTSDDLGSIDPKSLEKFRIGDRRYDWAAMSTSPEFGFGSGKNGSKRVKEQRILAILRLGDIWPLLVSVGGGSMKAWDKFAGALPAFHYECQIGLKAAKTKNKAGQPFSQIVAHLIATISEEQGEMARRIYTEPLTRMFAAPPMVAAGAEAADGDDE